MSSLRNAVKRITHKERAQPTSRRHLGILEKHGDYRERAADYHAKERQVKTLRTKAAQRNPDEFYFGMHRTQVETATGKHVRTKAARQADFDRNVGDETIRLLKDQDLRYIRLQKTKDTRQAERLQANLHLLEGGGGGGDEDDDEGGRGVASSGNNPKRRKHTIFVDSAEQAEKFDAAKHFETVPEMVNRPFNRRRLKDLEEEWGTRPRDGDDEDHDDDDDDDSHGPASAPLTRRDLILAERQARKRARTLARARERGYREVQHRRERVDKLAAAEAHLVTERLVAGKGRKRKIQPADGRQPAVYKWRRKRLR